MAGPRDKYRLIKDEHVASLRERFGDRLITFLTVIIAAWLFVVMPLHSEALISTELVGLAMALVVTVVMLVLSNSRVAAGLMLIAIGLATTAALRRLVHPSMLDVHLNSASWLIVGFVLIWWGAKAVFAPGRITYHRVMGAVLLYLAIGLTFATIYTFVVLFIPGSFQGIEVTDSANFLSTMIYLSFGTLSTAGAGDITAMHPIARSITNIEAMVGQLYPATLLARIVTLEIEGERDS